MSDTQINLIQKNTRVGQQTSVELMLRRSAWFFLSAVFLVSVAMSITYLVATNKMQRLDAEKTLLVRDINAFSVKEGLVLSLKDRTEIAGRALDAAKPWGKLFTVLSEIAGEDVFRTVSVEETGRVTASMKLSSVDEAVTMATNIMSLAKKRSLRSPQMLSFAFRESGEIEITMSFHPVFSL